MKKVFLSLMFLAAVAACSYSQTYYYKAVASFDKDGAKVKPVTKGKYITFTNNRSICYVSDANGYRIKIPYIPSYGTIGTSEEAGYNFYFKGTQSGTHIYQTRKVTYGYGIGTQETWANEYYYFSTDFNKMQHHDNSYYNNLVGAVTKTEYIRTDVPEEEKKDDVPVF
jgi:hypothetical protein